MADEFNFIWYIRTIKQNLADINIIRGHNNKNISFKMWFNWTEEFLNEVCLQVQKAWYCAQVRNCSLQVAVPKTPAGLMK